jgi:hypothetical protein
MSRSWLKLIGTTERPCPECYESCHADSRRRMHRIRPGDRMVLYAVGRGKRVFALATVSRAAYDSGRADWPYRVAHRDGHLERALPGRGDGAGRPLEGTHYRSRCWSLNRSGGRRAYGDRVTATARSSRSFRNNIG